VSEGFRAIRSASLLRKSSLDDGQRALTAADVHCYSNRVPAQKFFKTLYKTIGWIALQRNIMNGMIPHSCRLGRHEPKKQASKQFA
jgi:hypothetical protein